MVNQFDTRRLEVVVDGLPLFQGVQPAADTTLVCPLTREGAAKPRTPVLSGVSLQITRRRIEARYPELVGDGGRARLVVLAGEDVDAFSRETAAFLRGLAAVKVRDLLELLQGRARAAWLRRWGAMLALCGSVCFRALPSRQGLFRKGWMVRRLLPMRLQGDSRHFL